MARKRKKAKKKIPMSKRSGPKVRRGGKLVCKFGVAKGGKRRGHCLKSKRSKK